MNIEDFPEPIKKDIEDQSLSTLEHIKDDIIVIGGWAVRALTGNKHGRYTLDLDGVAEDSKIEGIESKLLSVGMNVRRNEWGTQYYHKYVPSINVPGDIRDEVEKVELRIEISGPKIKESHTDHYFEFSLTEFEKRKIPYHMKDEDSQVLLDICNVDKVIEVIKENDDWAEMVIRRNPKLIGRLSNKDRLEHIMAVNVGINIKDHIKTMKYIENELRSC